MDAERRIRPLRALIAPLIWVERVRGRRRLALLALYAIIAAMIGMLAWRSSRLSGLPDIGDPFDTAQVLAIDVPEERNAWTLWREASARVWRKQKVEDRLLKFPFSWPKPDDAEGLDYLARSAESLDLWRKGAERPDAMMMRPADFRRGYGIPRSAQGSIGLGADCPGDRLGGPPQGGHGGGLGVVSLGASGQPARGPQRAGVHAKQQHERIWGDRQGDRRVGRRPEGRRRAAEAGRWMRSWRSTT